MLVATFLRGGGAIVMTAHNGDGSACVPQRLADTRSACVNSAREGAMARLQLVSERGAQGEVGRVYAEIRETLGISFVPNFFKTLANSPTALRATWEAYRNNSWRGTVPTVLKEMMFVAISAARDCRYCEIAHLAFCKQLGADQGTRRSLVENLDALAPRRSGDVVRFAVKAAMTPAALDSTDYKRLHDHGISDAEIAEILAMTAFSMYATILADSLHLSVDAEFDQILAAT
jgi:uncharacterized peroxidase-related enzyme